MATAKIVIPCYNEEKRLPIETFIEFVSSPHNITFLFVDDGSTDGTLSLLESLRDRDPDRFALLCIPKNCGKAEAVRRGLLATLEESSAYVGFWDADLSTPLNGIIEFIDFAESHPKIELIMGSRVRLLGRQIERRASRHYLGRFFATAVSLILDMPVYDTQCGAKLFRVLPDLHRLFDRSFSCRWIFDVEIIARLGDLRRTVANPRSEGIIYEFPLSEWRDVGGSKLTYADFLYAGRDLLLIWYSYRRR
jgi:glycosyltransferase involved in cell wall biosynthesis